MTTSNQIIEDAVNTEYKHGFVTDIETDSAPPGLNEDIIRLISEKKDEPEFMPGVMNRWWKWFCMDVFQNFPVEFAFGRWDALRRHLPSLQQPS